MLIKSNSKLEKKNVMQDLFTFSAIVFTKIFPLAMEN